MPLKKLEKISSTRLVAIWEITETEDTLHHLIDPRKDSLEDLDIMKVLNKKLEWLAARVLIKRMAQCLQINYDGLSKNEDGKPLLNQNNSELSITHSYPYVAAIIDQQAAVGIDLEQPKEKLIKIASKFCSEDELAFASGDVRQLCVLWSAKEALYKIYSKRGLIFNEHLIVTPFKLEPAGTITGSIAVNESIKSYKLHYTVNDNFVLVYNLN